MKSLGIQKVIDGGRWTRALYISQNQFTQRGNIDLTQCFSKKEREYWDLIQYLLSQKEKKWWKIYYAHLNTWMIWIKKIIYC